MKKGFTLIELLVVVLIIGILSAVALPKYQRAVTKARFMQMETATKAVQEAQRIYYMENGEYAQDLDYLSVSFPKKTETNFQFKDITCDIGLSFVRCFMSRPNKISFYRFYDRSDHIQCCAYKEDNYAAEALCREKTGDTTWSSNCGTSGDGSAMCHCYSS